MQTANDAPTPADALGPEARGRRNRQWAQAAVLLLSGVYLLETVLTGEIAFYINERYNILAVIGGLILTAFGVAIVYTLLSEPTGARRMPTHTAPITWLSIAIMGFPLALGILVPARPLSASAVGSSGITTSLSPMGGAFNTRQFTTAPQDRNILDWVRMFAGSDTPEAFVGQPADVIGFVYRDIRFHEDSQFMVARFAVSCCVADAQALGVIVETRDAAQWPQDSWVRVRGRFDTRLFDGHKVPVLVVENIERIAEPERPYLFP